ncbi:MAG: RluA family pseudouridine synthase [bacterium]|nr:RluA family pseudouridine synthase [bacterium]
MEQHTFLVELNEEEQVSPSRLDSYLAQACEDLSRSRLKRLIEQGNVSVQEQVVCSPKHRLKPGDSICLTIPPVQPTHLAAQALDLDILFEDDYVVVINKPVGMVVHPGAGNPDHTLVNALLAHCGDSFLNIGGQERPGLVHRLDKDTSGLLVAAKTEKAYQGLVEQFSDRSIKRVYQALVWGVVSPLQGTIDQPIARHPRQRQKMAVLHNGRPSITHYQVLEVFPPYLSLIECQLETGRTHQIRVHMTSIHHPLFADSTYGRPPKGLFINDLKEASEKFKRQALHAKSLSFIHPISKERINFDSNLPEDFNELLENIRSSSFLNKK